MARKRFLEPRTGPDSDPHVSLALRDRRDPVPSLRFLDVSHLLEPAKLEGIADVIRGGRPLDLPPTQHNAAEITISLTEGDAEPHIKVSALRRAREAEGRAADLRGALAPGAATHPPNSFAFTSHG